jgi:dephospho-CoA kinase
MVKPLRPFAEERGPFRGVALVGLLVGLTGGMGSGKTLVAEILRELGAHIVDADQIGRDLVRPGSPVLAEIAAAFGEGVLLADGRLDRAKIAQVVFTDPGKRRLLEAILHPKIFEIERLATDKAFKLNPRAVVVVDAALLIESGNYKNMDKVVVIRCGEGEQIERLLAKKLWTREVILQRLRSQAPLEEKLKVADYVLTNDSTMDELRQRVEKMYRELQSLA